jgi:hypothetical protein
MAPLRILVLVAVTAAAGMLLTTGDDGGSPLPAPPPLTVPGHAPAAPVAPDPPAATLEAIAHCESRGDPTAVSADGVYRGKYQFDVSTWQSLGGSGDPALAGEREQDHRARALAAERGSAPWPVCGFARTGS